MGRQKGVLPLYCHVNPLSPIHVGSLNVSENLFITSVHLQQEFALTLMVPQWVDPCSMMHGGRQRAFSCFLERVGAALRRSSRESNAGPKGRVQSKYCGGLTYVRDSKCPPRCERGLSLSPFLCPTRSPLNAVCTPTSVAARSRRWKHFECESERGALVGDWDRDGVGRR